MKNLIKTTIAISSTEIALMVIALLKNKYLAVNIGPEGFGIYGILTSFFSMAAVFTCTWMAIGTMKYVSEYDAKNDRQSVNTVYTFSLVIAGSSALALTFLLLIKRHWFINTFLSSDINEIYFLIFTVSFIAISVGPILFSVLQGQKKIREVVIRRWGIAILDILIVLILVSFWGLTGFFVSISINYFLTVGFLLWGVRRNNGARLCKFSFKNPIIYSLMSFGSVNLFLSFINLMSQYLQRFIIVNNMDIVSVGLFQAGVGIMNHLGVINNGAQFLFFPKMAEIISHDIRSKNINDFLRLSLMSSIVLSAGMLLFGEWVVSILYSSKFMGLSSILYLFVIAQFITIVGGAFLSVVVGMSRLKMHTITTVTVHSLGVIVPLFFIKRYGIGALGVGFIVGGTIGAIMNWLYLRNYIGFRFSQEVKLLFIISLFTLCCAVLIKDSMFLVRVGWFIITFGLIGKMIRREEWAKGYNYFLPKLGKTNDNS